MSVNKNILPIIRRLAFAVASATALAVVLGITSQSARAADLRFPGDPEVEPAVHVPKIFEVPSGYTVDFGLRFWYGSGKTAKNLYDIPPSPSLVSRLTYSNLPIFNGEAFTRLDFNDGWFIKGNFGTGGLLSGHLKDEDFGLTPPLNPYSATLSDQKHGTPLYGTADIGVKLLRGPDFHIGVFTGYNFLRSTVNAFGCAQLADNPLICGNGGIPNNFRVITQVNNWNSFRVGVDAGVEINRLKLSGEAAYLPFVQLFGSDAHWLRIDPNTVGAFTGPIPEDGSGWGYQLEGVASYRLTDYLSIGIGGRYWHMETSGFTHFEGHVVGVTAFPQPVTWKSDNFGAFVQTSIKFGPYPLITGY